MNARTAKDLDYVRLANLEDYVAAAGDDASAGCDLGEFDEMLYIG